MIPLFHQDDERQELPMATSEPRKAVALVVDDEAGVRMCTADVLLDMGY